MSDIQKTIEELSPKKRELFELMLRKAQETTPPRRSGIILRRQDRDSYPLSFAQQRLWFINQFQPGTTAYNIPFTRRLKGPLDIAALERTINEIVRRHEALRTTFVEVDGKPAQKIAAAEAVTLAVTDLTSFPVAGREDEARRLALEEGRRPFDLANGPLLRVALLRLGEADHLVLLAMHHIISDGWSLGILLREIAVIYDAFASGKPSPLPELPVQYADYASWQREWLQGDVLNEQVAYWRDQLADAPPHLDLPTDHARPAIQTYRGATHKFIVSPALYEGIKALSRQEGVTLFMTLLAAFDLLLRRYTNQDDIVVGTAIANRNFVETEDLIGFFVNTLALRTTLAGDPTVRELIGNVRAASLGASAHQDLPFEKLVEELQPQRDLSRPPFCQVNFDFQSVPSQTLRFANLAVTPFTALDISTSMFDMTLNMLEEIKSVDGTDAQLAGTFKYNTDLFDAETIERLAEHYQNVLTSLVADPDQRISQVAILSAAESQKMIGEWNQTRADYPQGRSIHCGFEEQAERTPDAVAVTFEGEQLSYGELNRKANRLANYLRSIGVGQEVSVGICMERSIEMVIAVLATLKSGGAFVPMDPAYPLARLAFMLEDSRVAVLLTQSRVTENLPNHYAKEVPLDAMWETLSQHTDDNLADAGNGQNLAYVIYTSGSTGVPKGVQVAHDGVCNLAKAQIGAFDVQPESNVLQVASLSFDASVSELFMALLSGATLCLARQEAIFGAALARTLKEQAITTATIPPSVLATVPDEDVSALKTLIVAGEACSIDLARKWAKGRKFLNAYGPTETTVCASIGRYSEAATRLTIGRPIANHRIYLLDSRLQPAPVGVPGEIHVGGVGLARGYLNHADLTAERFIPNPFASTPGERLYKTGDLARYLSDGSIEFAGRLDDQVKVRGFRIELGEIEAALRQHVGVDDAAVLVQADGSGQATLVAYVVAQPDQALTSKDLRGFLRKRLPDYMLPASFKMLTEMPLTTSGKIDRKALPGKEAQAAEVGDVYVAPKTELEIIISAIWQEVLKVEKVGLYDNFFDLGGHSLAMAEIFAKLQARISSPVTLIELFEHPTVGALAKFLSRDQNERSAFQQPPQSAERAKEGKNRLRQQFRQRHQAGKKR